MAYCLREIKHLSSLFHFTSLLGLASFSCLSKTFYLYLPTTAEIGPVLLTETRSSPVKQYEALQMLHSGVLPSDVALPPIFSKHTQAECHSCASTGGFALQSYKGAQKPTPMEMMKAQATRLSEDSAGFKAPPKMEIPTVEGKRQTTRPHKLKHRDMNVLTPSGF